MRESVSASAAILLSPACCPPLPPPARGPPSFQTDTCIYFSLLCISHFPLWVPLPAAAGASRAGPAVHLSLLAAAPCQPHLSCPKRMRREGNPFPLMPIIMGCQLRPRVTAPVADEVGNEFLLSTYCIPRETASKSTPSPYSVSEMHSGNEIYYR